MSKQKNEEVIDQQTESTATAIEAGKTITIEADSRQEASEQLNALRKQAEAEGLIQADGGFVMYNAAGNSKFTAAITFTKP